MVELIKPVILALGTSAAILGVAFGAVLCNEGNGWGGPLLVPGAVFIAIGVSSALYPRDRS